MFNAREDEGLIDQRAAMKFQPELMSSESLQWAGVPNPRVIFHSEDWYMIPFGLFWGGFTMFWEAGALGYWGNGSKNGATSTFMVIWGIPFILVGQYFIWADSCMRPGSKGGLIMQ